jgi:hypothetical protein
MAVSLTLGTAQPAKVSTDLSFANTFTDSLGVLNCAVVADYLFGTAASGSSPVIPIRNLTDLAVYFNPQADVSGTSVQVEAIERYQSFNTTNHAFGTDHLSLTAALEAGGNADVLQLSTNAPTTSSTVLNFASTTGVQDGQIVAISGAFTASLARVVSHDAVSVTIGQSVTVGSGVTVYFLNAFVPSSAVAGSGTTATYGTVPSGIANGMFYNNITSGTFGTKRVTGKTGTTITYDGSVSQATSDFCILSPPITSGQIWTKAGYQPGKSNANVIAGELTCQIPAASKQGAWPAFWGYSRSSEGFSFDASELDFFEFNNCATATPSDYSGNTHGGWYQRELYKKFIGVHSSYWDASGFYRPSGRPDYSAATHKFQFIWTMDRIYRFIDGVLISCFVFPWSSNCTMQIGMNLGAGSFIPAYVSVLLFPLLTSQFPYSYDLYELKLWQA